MKEQLYKFMKFVLPLLIVILISSLLGTVFLTAVYFIPTKYMKENVKKSALIFKNEETYPSIFNGVYDVLDNWTDALMILEATNESQEPVIKKAMSNYHLDKIHFTNPTIILVNEYLDQNQETTNFTNVEYTRYWHGYLIFLKPLLTIISYGEIRILNAIFLIVTLIITIFLMIKRSLKEYILPYLIVIMFLNPVSLSMSMQYSTCYYIIAIGSIIILWLKEKLEKYEHFVFLGIGIATAFFDFLTYPIATLGIPTIFYLCSIDMNKKELKEIIFKGIKLVFCWGMGYGLMWFNKWVIASIILKHNFIQNALVNILCRTNHSEQYTAIKAITFNVKAFFTTPVTLIFFVYSIIMYMLLIVECIKKYIEKENNNVKILKYIIPFVILIIIPFMWYAIATNHSQAHAFMTNKALIVSAFAHMCLLLKIYREFKENENN